LTVAVPVAFTAFTALPVLRYVTVTVRSLPAVYYCVARLRLPFTYLGSFALRAWFVGRCCLPTPLRLPLLLILPVTVAFDLRVTAFCVTPPRIGLPGLLPHVTCVAVTGYVRYLRSTPFTFGYLTVYRWITVYALPFAARLDFRAVTRFTRYPFCIPFTPPRFPFYTPSVYLRYPRFRTLPLVLRYHRSPSYRFVRRLLLILRSTALFVQLPYRYHYTAIDSVPIPFTCRVCTRYRFLPRYHRFCVYFCRLHGYRSVGLHCRSCRTCHVTAVITIAVFCSCHPFPRLPFSAVVPF